MKRTLIGLKGHLTRQINKCQNLSQQSPVDYFELEDLLQVVESKFAHIKQHMSLYLTELHSTSVESSELEDVIDDLAQYEEDIRVKLLPFKKQIAKNKLTVASAARTDPDVKLPQINIPTFSDKHDLATMKLKIELAKLEREQQQAALQMKEGEAAIKREEQEREADLKERELALKECETTILREHKHDLATMKLKIELAKLEREQQQAALQMKEREAAIKREEQEREADLKERELALKECETTILRERERNASDEGVWNGEDDEGTGVGDGGEDEGKRETHMCFRATTMRDRDDLKARERDLPTFDPLEAEAFFRHFERIATLKEWPEEDWAVLVQSRLTGEAREAYNMLDIKECAIYNTIRSAVVLSYRPTPEVYMKGFRDCTRASGSHVIVTHRLHVELKQLIVMEKFMLKLHLELKVRVKKAGIKDLKAAVDRSDMQEEALQLRMEGPPRQSPLGYLKVWRRKESGPVPMVRACQIQTYLRTRNEYVYVRREADKKYENDIANTNHRTKVTPQSNQEENNSERIVKLLKDNYADREVRSSHLVHELLHLPPPEASADSLQVFKLEVESMIKALSLQQLAKSKIDVDTTVYRRKDNTFILLWKDKRVVSMITNLHNADTKKVQKRKRVRRADGTSVLTNESLVLFKTQLAFKQYIPSKRHQMNKSTRAVTKIRTYVREHPRRCINRLSYDMVVVYSNLHVEMVKIHTASQAVS
ncbi:uncharacterized protein [Procambarus clarkii]|uniref:uncharacterized protein n=1 Tax=Procambarus clarkii TaxID=6728 RepID=UPI0037423F14